MGAHPSTTRRQVGRGAFSPTCGGSSPPAATVRTEAVIILRLGTWHPWQQYAPGDIVYVPFFDEETPDNSVVLEMRMTGVGFEGFTVSETIENPDAMDDVVLWTDEGTEWCMTKAAAEAVLRRVRLEAAKHE